MDELVPQSDEAERPARTTRKPWRTPQFMLSQVPETQHAASPLATDGTFISQAS